MLKRLPRPRPDTILWPGQVRSGGRPTAAALVELVAAAAAEPFNTRLAIKVHASPPPWPPQPRPPPLSPTTTAPGSVNHTAAVHDCTTKAANLAGQLDQTPTVVQLLHTAVAGLAHLDTAGASCLLQTLHLQCQAPAPNPLLLDSCPALANVRWCPVFASWTTT